MQCASAAIDTSASTVQVVVAGFANCLALLPTLPTLPTHVVIENRQHL